MNTRDETLPEDRWTFDKGVTQVFDDMLARSIPQYEVMRRAVFDLGSRYVQPKTAVIDLGCSRGEALAPFVDRFGANNRYVGVEISEPMLMAAQERFAGYIRCHVVDIRGLDLRHAYPPEQASLTLSVLTLQFTPIEYRQRIVRDVFKHTVAGGAFLLVEKVLGATADLDAQMVETYYALKSANGYTQEQIDRKRLSLEGVLVPVTAKWNEELLSTAGFKQIDCIWRWMNFAAWIAVKD
ncbi:methyltransferase domain-containing protein [Chloroflexi bacterium CFX3]|nr:methyltransferase domain-containing protein [Chloroflexi bacterium CFX3]